MTGEMLEGLRLEVHTAVWPFWKVLSRCGCEYVLSVRTVRDGTE